MVTVKDKENMKSEFEKWLILNTKENSGVRSSYLRALDLLSESFYKYNKINNQSIFDIHELSKLNELYHETLKIQRDKGGYLYRSDAPSYGAGGFYSASLKKYIDYIKSSYTVTEPHNFNLKDTFSECLKNSGLLFPEHLITRFIACLYTKPFVILTGLSGSGKTKLAQAFVKWICEKDYQYKIIPVGADWTNREPLLGYPNALKNGEYILPENGGLELILDADIDPDKPYFLILDEMNLSHVERYFADFLSAMESGESIALHADSDDWNDCAIPSKFSLPNNLFVIGTVNIDETTYMFSPKVLDRASVIEFRVSELEMNQYLKEIKPLYLDSIKGLGAEMAESFVELSKNKNLQPKDTGNLNSTLIRFFNELKKTGAEFGYRSASEINRFAAVANELDPTWKMDAIVDCAIMQKLLPKVHGSRSKLNPVLTSLAKLCIKDGTTDFLEKDDEFRKAFFIAEDKITDDNKKKIIYPLSFEKITRMHKNAIDNGFTSYAEA